MRTQKKRQRNQPLSAGIAATDSRVDRRDVRLRCCLLPCMDQQSHCDLPEKHVGHGMDCGAVRDGVALHPAAPERLQQVQRLRPLQAIADRGDGGVVCHHARSGAAASDLPQQLRRLLPTQASSASAHHSVARDRARLQPAASHCVHNAQSAPPALALLASADCRVVRDHVGLQTVLPHRGQEPQRLPPLAPAELGTLVAVGTSLGRKAVCDNVRP
mmetsp:Transcript_52139/g.163756  ORF Transcript_52139/g.163756 Transcript_52139/m.163756 type:complete len:216 (+) Transcript_52139:484-1131(+)